MLRGQSYDAGRAMLSPEGGAVAKRTGDVQGHAAVKTPEALHVGVGGAKAGRSADGGVGLHAGHVGVHKAAAEQVSASVAHKPSGLGAGMAASDAKIHHADVHNADVSLGRSGLNANAEKVSWLNAGASDLQASAHAKTRRAGVGAQNLAVHATEVNDASFHLGNRGLDAKAGHVGFTNVAADQVDLSASSDSGRSAGLNASGLQIHDLDVDGASFQADKSGARAHADNVHFENLGADHLAMGVKGKHAQAALAAEQLSIHDTHVGNADWSVDGQGMHASAGSVDFNNLQADHVGGSVGIGDSAKFAGGVDNLNVHEVGVRDAAFNMGLGGIDAKAAEVNWLNTGLENAQANWSGSGGAQGNASLDALRVHELAVKDGSFSLGKDGVSASGGVDYTHAALSGLDVSHQTAGGTQLSAGVDQATIGAVGADRVALDTNLISGQAAIDNGHVVEHDLKGARAQIGAGGQTLLGAQGDLHASHSVDEARAAWDFRKGQASASVAGYTHDRSLSNATLNVLGEEIEIPELALHVEADAHAEVDVSDGELDLGLDLSGTEIRIGDTTVTLPEEAQLGVDIDLSAGELNLNIGGHEIDVDGAVGKFWGRLKGLFGGGKAEKASGAEIQQGREAIRGLKRAVPRMKDDIRTASRLKRYAA
ncbi:MAG: hypothetical protein KC502_09945 [Myxococcales bacterium]|nr:hypothetical protein [Myxococcales bacterium]